MKTVCIILSILFLILSCSSEEDKIEKKINLSYSKNTKLVDDEASNSIISYDNKNNELILKKDASFAKSISIGDILIGGATKELPNGILKKVESIENQAENIVIKTKYAFLNEAIIDGKIKETLELKPENIVEFKKYYTEKKVDNSIDYKEYNTQFIHNFTVNIGEGDKAIKISGTAGIAPSFDVDIDIGLSLISKFSMKLNLKTTASISLSGKYDAKYNPENTILATYKFSPITIPSTPITLCPELSLYIGFNGEINGELSFNATQRAQASISAEFNTSLTENVANEFLGNEGTWGSIDGKVENEFDWSEPYFNVNGNLRTYVGSEISIGLFEYKNDALIDTANIAISANLFLKANIDMLANPWWFIDAGLFGTFKSSGKLLPDSDLEIFEVSSRILEADGEYDPNANIIKGISNLYYFNDEDSNFYRPFNIIKILPQNDETNLAIIQVNLVGGYYLAKMDKKGKILSAIESFIFCDDKNLGNINCSPFDFITDAIDIGDSLIVVGDYPTISKVDKKTAEVIWAKQINDLSDPNDIDDIMMESGIAFQPIILSGNNYAARLTRSIIFFDGSGNLSLKRFYYYSSDILLDPDPEFWKMLTIKSIAPSEDKVIANVSYMDVPWVLYKEGSTDTIEISAGGSVLNNKDIFNDHDYSDDLKDFIANPDVSIINENNEQIIAGNYIKNTVDYTHWITKLDNDNNVLWRTPFCLSIKDNPMKCDFEEHENAKGYKIKNIALLDDNSIILSGSFAEEKLREDGEIDLDNSSFIIKFTNTGNFAWGKVFNTEEGRFLQSNSIDTIVQRNDKKGIILGGKHQLNGIDRAWFVFLTETGDVLFKDDSQITIKNLGGIFDLSLTKKTMTNKNIKSDADTDNDFVCDGNLDVENVCFAGPDNCPNVPNRLQLDHDNDGKGDECDDDDDDDSYLDINDNCPFIVNNQDDDDNDGIGNECDLHDKETKKFGSSTLSFFASSHNKESFLEYNDWIGLEFETSIISK